MLNNYTVYKHTFPNGKIYIGITKQAPSKRWRNGTGYSGQKAEERKKRSEALKGHIVTKETKLKTSKSVYCVELNKVFPSIKEAGATVGITDTNITNCCKGRIKTAGGYHWKYAGELV